MPPAAGNNEDMIVKYREDLKGTVTTSAPGIMGDGIVMAQEVGADLVDIEQIQLHPTVEQKTSMLITESVRGDGAILVNQDGKRFTNELLTRDVVSAAELEQPGSYAYIIFDQKLRDGLKAIENMSPPASQSRATLSRIWQPRSKSIPRLWQKH